MLPPRPCASLFPYTTLFRSGRSQHARSLEQEPDHADVEGSVERVEFRSGRDVRLQNSGVHLVVEHRQRAPLGDRKSTRLNSSHRCISYAVFCLKKKKNKTAE